MTGRTFLDTNVAVYAYDDDDPTKQHIASAVLENGRASVVSTQVLAEFYVTVTRKLARPLSSEEGREATMRLAEFPVVPHDRALVLEAIHLANRHQLSLWDAM